MTRARGGAWLAAVVIVTLAAGLFLRPAAARTDMPELSEARLETLDGFVSVVSLLPGADHDFICLLGPYDETALRVANDAMPFGLRGDLLEPIFPIDEDEFHIVGLTATGAKFNHYDREGIDVLSGFSDLDPTAWHVRDSRILCGRTEDVSFYLMPRGNRRAMGIALIETRRPVP